ncbi:hypothetical protein B0O80DRAFT_502302 [Mortierella sp. GBAus27b]|nr:hypothetical protein B0O80DRAFT_502302 [Mortierella sp. GBAus27b]
MEPLIEGPLYLHLTLQHPSSNTFNRPTAYSHGHLVRQDNGKLTTTIQPLMIARDTLLHQHIQRPPTMLPDITRQIQPMVSIWDGFTASGTRRSYAAAATQWCVSSHATPAEGNSTLECSSQNKGSILSTLHQTFKWSLLQQDSGLNSPASYEGQDT